MIYSFILPTDEVISFDCVSKYSETFTSKISDYETEVGFPISDNMVLSTPTISISGVFSYYNSPTREITLVNGEFVVFDVEGKQTTTQIDIEKKLKDIYNDKTNIILIKSTDITNIVGSEVDRIAPCLIESLSFSYSGSGYGAVTPEFQLRNVRQAVVIEQNVPNASPVLIPKNKVATTVNQASATGDAPDGTSTDPIENKDLKKLEADMSDDKYLKNLEADMSDDKATQDGIKKSIADTQQEVKDRNAEFDAKQKLINKYRKENAPNANKYDVVRTTGGSGYDIRQVYN